MNEYVSIKGNYLYTPTHHTIDIFPLNAHNIYMNIAELFYPLEPTAICISILCGFIVGLERQLSGKPAGIRTSALICLGTYIFVAAADLLGKNTDPSRIIGQIVTGIGFIGAGVILSREGIVLGVTSAAVIWVLASIGIMIGLGNYTASVLLSIITIIILTGVNLLATIFKSLQRGVYEKFKKTLQKETDYE